MLAHVPHVLVYAGLCALPLLIWLPLCLFADDHPRSDEPPDTDGEDPSLVALVS